MLTQLLPCGVVLLTRVRNCLTEVVTFCHNDSNAIAFLVEVGFDEDAVRALPPGQFIARRLDTGTEESGKVF